MEKKPVFMKEEFRQGIGTVAIYDDGEEQPLEYVIKPTREYNIASRFIDRLLAEKVYKVKLNKNKLDDYVV